MRTKIAKGIAVLLASGMILAGGVDAIAAPGLHNVSAKTSLTISRRPSGPVKSGTLVTFSGRLKSSAAVCKQSQKIFLLRAHYGKVGKTKTNSKGKWTIKTRVRSTGKYRAVYKGINKGVHPNITVCFGSNSSQLKVVVK